MLERQYFLYDKCNTNERNRQTVLFYGESLRSCGKAWRRTGQKAYLLCDYFRVSDCLRKQDVAIYLKIQGFSEERKSKK